MARTFGEPVPALTQAIRRVGRGPTECIEFTAHALDEMEQDGFDQADVLQCLRRGFAYGPEYRKGEFRANVLHNGLKIRVVVGSVGADPQDWRELRALTVVTVMEDK